MLKKYAPANQTKRNYQQWWQSQNLMLKQWCIRQNNKRFKQPMTMQPNQVLKTWPTGQEVPEVTKQPKPDAKKYGLQVEHKMPHFWLWVKGKFLHLSSVIIWGTSTYLLQQPAKLPLLLLELQPPKESLLKAHCTPGVKLKALVFEESISGDTWFCCSTQCAERVLLCSLFQAL